MGLRRLGLMVVWVERLPPAGVFAMAADGPARGRWAHASSVDAEVTSTADSSDESSFEGADTNGWSRWPAVARFAAQHIQNSILFWRASRSPDRRPN
jgi:hypothetical protein